MAGGWDWWALCGRARQLGIPAAEYWGMTPAEFVMECDAARERLRDQHDAIVLGAWYGEYVRLRTQQKKRLEPVTAYLADRGQVAAKVQSAAEMKAAMQQIAEIYHIPYRRVDESTEQAAR